MFNYGLICGRFNGRIHESWVSEGELWGDASRLVEEFFGSSGFDPGSQADHGFGVFAEPVDRVAFDAEIDDSADRAFDRATANRHLMIACPAVVHAAMVKAVSADNPLLDSAQDCVEPGFAHESEGVNVTAPMINTENCRLPGEWLPAGNLQPGDPLQALNGPVSITDTSSLHPGATRVFNLEIEGDHVYRVAEFGILVHNNSPVPPNVDFGCEEKSGNGRLTPLRQYPSEKKSWRMQEDL